VRIKVTVEPVERIHSLRKWNWDPKRLRVKERDYNKKGGGWGVDRLP